MRTLEIRCVKEDTYEKSHIKVDLNNVVSYRIEHQIGTDTKHIGLDITLGDKRVRLSSKSKYTNNAMITETNSIGDKLKYTKYGDNVLVYRGSQCIYGYDDNTKELNWVFESLIETSLDFDFDETHEYKPKPLHTVIRNNDGSIISRRFRTLFSDRVKITSQVLKLKNKHSKFQKMYDILLSQDVTKHFDGSNDGLKLCSDVFEAVLYTLHMGAGLIGEKIISKLNKKVLCNKFIYDDDMIWLGRDENTRYVSTAPNAYIYFMDTLKEIESETFANRVHNYNKNDAYIIVTPNSIAVFNGDMEKVCQLIMDDSKVVFSLYNGDVSQKMSRLYRETENWLSVDVIVERTAGYNIKLYLDNGDFIIDYVLLSNFINRIQDKSIVLEKDMEGIVKGSLGIKENDEIIYDNDYRFNVSAPNLNLMGVVERTISPNMILRTPFALRIMRSPLVVIKDKADGKPELIFKCDIDADLIPTMKNALSTIPSRNPYHNIFKSMVSYVTESISITELDNPNILATSIYNKFVDAYNKSNNKDDDGFDDVDTFKEKVNALLKGEIKELRTHIHYHNAKKALQELDFDVCDRDCDDKDWRWETNGWQCDYWTFAIKDDIEYDIQGGLYYGDFNMTLAEDEYEQDKNATITDLLNGCIDYIEVTKPWIELKPLLESHGCVIMDNHMKNRDAEWEVNGVDQDYYTYCMYKGVRYDISGSLLCNEAEIYKHGYR